MKFKTLPLLIFCSTVFFITSCVNSPEPPEEYSDVEGVVTENGNPVANADIHIKNHFDPGGFVEGENIPVEIEFTTTSVGVYKLDLYRLGSNELLATVFEDTLEVGEQTLTIPDSLLTNGIYIYQLITPTEERAENNFLINQPDSALVLSKPLLRTNAQGEFLIDVDFLAIDVGFRRGDEQFEITDSLQIIVVEDSAIVGREYLQVGSDDNFVEVSLD